jgi:hypothetical protein
MTRAEAAKKAAYWAERAEQIAAGIVKLGDNLPNLEHRHAHSYQRQKAAEIRADIAAQEKARVEAVQMAAMWVGVAEALSDGDAS